MSDGNGVVAVNRAAELDCKLGPIKLSQTGCYAIREGEQISVFNPQDARLYSFVRGHIPFEEGPLLVTLQLYFFAFNAGRANLQQEIKSNVSNLFRLVL